MWVGGGNTRDEGPVIWFDTFVNVDMDGFGGDRLSGLKNRENKVIGEEWNSGRGSELGVVVGHGPWAWISSRLCGCSTCHVRSQGRG